MPTIKGTWKFNNVLDNTGQAMQPYDQVNFTVTTLVPGYDTAFTVYCTEINFTENENMFFHVDYTVPESLLSMQNIDVYRYPSWNTAELGEGIQTITFMGEQVVSDWFYNWIHYNAVEVKPKTLKGTWRFNDVLTQGHFYNDIDGLTQEYFDYQTVAVINGESVTLYCSAMYQEPFEVGSGSLAYTCSSSDPDLTALGITYPFGRYVYNGSYDTPDSDSWDYTYGEGIQTITIPTEQEVSDEFYAWFTENATEQREIGGKWKVNGTIDVIPYETLQLSYDSNSTDYISEHGVNIAPLEIFSPIMEKMLTVYRVAPPNTFLSSYNPDGSLNLARIAYIGCTVDGNDVPSIYCPVEAIPNLEFDFGGSQQISKVTYDWIMQNAKKAVAEIRYDGEGLAVLYPGQTATLKCKDKKMTDHLTVQTEGPV